MNEGTNNMLINIAKQPSSGNHEQEVATMHTSSVVMPLHCRPLCLASLCWQQRMNNTRSPIRILHRMQHCRYSLNLRLFSCVALVDTIKWSADEWDSSIYSRSYKEVPAGGGGWLVVLSSFCPSVQRASFIDKLNLFVLEIVEQSGTRALPRSSADEMRFFYVNEKNRTGLEGAEVWV